MGALSGENGEENEGVRPFDWEAKYRQQVEMKKQLQ